MLNRVKVLSCIFAALILAGCASSGSKFSMSAANQVTNGMTREEVIRVMGSKPTTVAQQGKVMVWSHVRANGFTGSAKSLAVKFSFDDDGKTYGVPEGGVYGPTAKYQ